MKIKMKFFLGDIPSAQKNPTGGGGGYFPGTAAGTVDREFTEVHQN